MQFLLATPHRLLRAAARIGVMGLAWVLAVGAAFAQDVLPVPELTARRKFVFDSIVRVRAIGGMFKAAQTAPAESARPMM